MAQIKRLHPEIPAFDEALELLHGRVALEVEIKNASHEPGYQPSGTTIARDVVTALRRHAFTDAFVSSFDPKCLRSVQEFDRGISTGLLMDRSSDLDQALDTIAGSHALLLPEARALERAGKTFIDRAHDRGIRLCTWTVDDGTSIRRLFDLGVDAVETNDPALGVVVRDRIRASDRHQRS
jgi:glycerophosphoryl diester phosphodiesterase